MEQLSVRILNESHFDIRAQRELLSNSSAELALHARVGALREGEYNFTLAVPTPNSGGGPQSAEIEGVFSIRAQTNLLRSDIDFSNSTAMADVVLTPLESVKLQITARDVDGYIIERDGERIVLTVRRKDGSAERDEFLASFNRETGRYEAVVKNLGTVGEYVVGLQDSDTSVDKGIHLRVECVRTSTQYLLFVYV